MLENSQATSSSPEFGTVTKTIPLFGGEIPEGSVVKIVDRYRDSTGKEYLSIKGGLECNGVSADRVVVKPDNLPF